MKNALIDQLQPAAHAALRTALRLKVFEGWTAGSVKTIEDLAGETGAEVVLIGAFDTR